MINKMSEDDQLILIKAINNLVVWNLIKGRAMESGDTKGFIDAGNKLKEAEGRLNELLQFDAFDIDRVALWRQKKMKHN